jgi:hypothetical protein
MKLKSQTVVSRRREEGYRNMGGPEAFGRRSGVPPGLRVFRCATLLADDPNKLDSLKRLTRRAVDGAIAALREASKRFDRGAANDLLQVSYGNDYVFEQVREEIGRRVDSADRKDLEECEHTVFMATAFRVLAKGKCFGKEVFSLCMKAAEEDPRGALHHYLRAYRVAEVSGLIAQRNEAKENFISECESRKAYSIGAKAVEGYGWLEGAGESRDTFAKWKIASRWERVELLAHLGQKPTGTA